MKARTCTPALLRILAAVLCTVLFCESSASAQGYGTLTGRFVLEGDVPEIVVLVKKGDATVKDAEVCAAETMLKNDLIIDRKTKGIQNIFVYLPQVKDIHPDLKKPAEMEQKCNVVGCRITPHALVVRTGQTVAVGNKHSIIHNLHPYPLRNHPVGYLARPDVNRAMRFSFDLSEPLPILVRCDIHPWMQAYWLILDHPFAAVTGRDGSFRITQLLAGRHEFTVWHERAGYVNSGAKRGFQIDVVAGETTDLGTVKVPLRIFED